VTHILTENNEHALLGWFQDQSNSKWRIAI